jgi:hypothetical protein
MQMIMNAAIRTRRRHSLYIFDRRRASRFALVAAVERLRLAL